MADYEEVIREQVEEFVENVRNEFAGTYDWIEGIDSETSLGLEHLDAEENPEEYLNKNPLEVRMSVSTEGWKDERYDKFDSTVEEFAQEEYIDWRVTEATGDYCVYTFYLHGNFLEVPE